MNTGVAGDLHIANEVISDIIGNAALECYGVVGMAAPNAVDGIAKILPTSRLRRGVLIASSEKGLLVDLYIVVEYGTAISAVSHNLVDQVSFAITEYTRMPVDSVNIHVQGVKVRQ